MRILLPLLFLGITGMLNAQEKRSFHGKIHTPQGRLHALVIFVGYTNTDSTDDFHNWPHDQIPDWARGANNALFNSAPSAIGSHQNLSRWFDVMSMGQFKFTGDIFPEQIMVKPGGYHRNRQVFEKINAKYPDFPWHKYDRRQNLPYWKRDNSKDTAGDGRLDYVMLLYRDGKRNFGKNAVLGGNFKLYTKRDTFSTDHASGFTGLRIDNRAQGVRGFIIHEFGHSLYRAPHIGAANGVVGDYFRTSYGWGMVTAPTRPLNCANAWERWYLGWQPIRHDLTTIDDTGTYVLRDYLTTGDAMRINIPNTDQHLWLENHQGMSPYDDHTYHRDGFGKPFPEPEPGLRMYVEDIAGDHAEVNIFRKGANAIKYLHAGGHYDYAVGDSRIVAQGWWGQDVRDHHIIAPNPISGQHPMNWIRADYGKINGRDQQGHILYNPDPDHPSGSGGNEHKMFLRLNGQRVDGPLGLDMAFREGDALNLGTNPVITSYPKYDAQRQQTKPIYLNNLSVKVLSVDSSGTMRLRVDYDHQRIHQDTRWTGPLVMKNDTAVMGDVPMGIRLDTGRTLTLDQSFSPSRETPAQITDSLQAFALPTLLRLEKGTRMVLEEGAALNIKNGASLRIDSGATLVMKEDSRLNVERSAYLCIDPDARVIRSPQSRIHMKGSKGLHPLRKPKALDCMALPGGQ